MTELTDEMINEDVLLLQKYIIAGFMNGQESYMSKEHLKKLANSMKEAEFVKEYQYLFRKIKDLLNDEVYPDFVNLKAKISEPSEKKKVNQILSESLEWEEIYKSRVLGIDYSDLESRVKIFKESRLKLALGNAKNIDEIRARIQELEIQGKDRWFSKEDLMVLLNKEIEEQKQVQESKIEALDFPVKLLNEKIGYLRKGEYTIIAARPGLGKSAFMEQIGVHNALKGKKVLFATAEMSAEQLRTRTLSRLSRLNLFNTDYQKLSGEAERQIQAAREKFPENFFVYNFFKVSDLEATIQAKARDFDLIIVDYLQRLEPIKYSRGQYEKVTNVSFELSNMAVRYNLPFLVASQFSRLADGEQPKLSHLRDSGQIEQDANIVLTLWEDFEDNELLLDNTPYKFIRLDCLKSRNGVTFENSDSKFYKLKFTGHLFEFTDAP